MKSTPARKPRQTRGDLSQQAIVATALEIADADGADAVTMRRLASQLRVTAPALYSYFHTRDDLLTAVAELAFNGIDTEIHDREPPEAQIRRILDSVWQASCQHPALRSLVGAGPHYPDSGRRLLQALLILLRRAGYPPEPAVLGARALVWTTFGFIQASGPHRTRMSRTGPPAGDVVAIDVGVIAPEDLSGIADCVPHLATLDLRDVFQHAIDFLLTGMAGRGHRTTAAGMH